MPDPDSEETTEDAEDQSVVRSASFRFKWLSTIVTPIITLAYTALVLGQKFGVTQQPVDPGAWATFSLAFISVLAYSVGVDTLKAAAEVRSKK